jgi:hypothetical protein
MIDNKRNTTLDGTTKIIIYCAILAVIIFIGGVDSAKIARECEL